MPHRLNWVATKISTCYADDIVILATSVIDVKEKLFLKNTAV